LTPQQYEKMVRSTLAKSDTIKVDVIDIFVTPDYISLMWDCIDHDLKHCWKRDETQLQWKFEVRPEGRDADHRVGVNSTYRSHDAEYVFEILEIDPKITPQYTTDFRVAYNEVPNQPTADNPDEHINFLIKFPNEPIKPAGFFGGSSATFTTTLQDIANWYKLKSKTFTEWSEFAPNMPSTDNVRDYLDAITARSYVPLKIQLFGDIPLDNTTPIEPTKSRIRTTFGVIDYDIFDGQPIPRTRSTASVSHRGHKKTNPSRITLSDPVAARSPEEAYALFVGKILGFECEDVTKEGLYSYLNQTDLKYAKSWTKPKLLET
jgi:hypothetical protein